MQLSGSFILYSLLAVFLLCMTVQPVQGQQWRLSGGYTIQHFDMQYVENPAYGGRVGYMNKGVVELELERYLLYRLYLGANANIQVHNQESVFMGGPMDFRQANLGLITGMQWSRLGLYAGVQAGRIWDLRFRADSRNSTVVHIDPESSSDSGWWTTGLRAGFKYYLLQWVRLQGEIVQHVNLPGDIEPQSAAGTTAHIRRADFNPYSFRVGISIGIPWHSQRRLEQVQQKDRLPIFMEAGGTNFRSPMRDESYITSPYGSRWGRNHDGVDLTANRGDAVVASGSGVVTQAGRQSGYGRMVEIRHSGGYTTRYAHLHRIRVREGQSVRRGEVIGSAGSSGSATGVHLHFELRRNGQAVDPTRYVRF